jgi:hypothetical protein
MDIPRSPLDQAPTEPGWWLASDRLWYPPESRPGIAPTQQQTPFRLLAVRTADDHDESMYPVLGDDKNLIAFEELDGQSRDHLVGTSLWVRELVGDKLIERFADLKIKVDVFITDGRVAVACDKYDKGGGWIVLGGGGGALFEEGALNAVSHVLAARRRRGKVLVGHVRYPWMIKVGFTSRVDGSRAEVVRVMIKERQRGADVAKMLDVKLPSDVDAGEVARRIAQQCGAYHLRHTTMDDAARDKCTTLTHAERLKGEAGKFAFYAIPVWYRANPQTAYPKQPEPSQ